MAWVPLECNPEVMTKLLHKVGVPKKWNIVDVYGVDPDMLAILPRPVLAMILLYPLSEKEAPEMNEESQADDDKSISPNVYFLKQFISNACGTIALIHSLANNTEELQLEDGFLKSFLDKTKDLSSTERGELLIKADDLIETHKELAQEGQTEAPSENTPVFNHFVAFVQKDGHIYELDGRKDAPINHGVSTAATFLEDAARVCQEYMKRDPEQLRFSMVALTPAE
ncbi:ubiquitin carboxyl-terminal hydrolase isozyme L3-like isoform X2 [Belonocnema kinseyi]|uniref:ubiquitin carboxyl-terminal hydrolase isozyme L3-like isoform X2 n=1 Tax=Belonocnema kinseyi TaxID=2817044 RepID=UPI00143CEA71|nr:ubiquitin carboxyl-terminal hydrolase isozyme L3-like isoform X2 [Belonocnema kinseyi]